MCKMIGLIWHTDKHTYASTQFFNQAKGKRCGSGYLKLYYIRDIGYVLLIVYYGDLWFSVYILICFFNVLFEVVRYAGRNVWLTVRAFKV